MKKCLAPALAAVVVACSAPSKTDPNQAVTSINAEDLMRHIRMLASDEFEGRLPGTDGENLTVEYLTQQFQAMGLRPGNPDGGFIQKVPLAGIRSDSKVTIAVRGKPLRLAPLDDYVAVSRRLVPDVEVSQSEMIFVGYGVVAPEYGWDDYKDVDVKGKTIVMLINDPAVPHPADASKLDDSMFKGRAMTYYGRWTYKYEIAAQKGAAAAVIIHETGPAGYPWGVVRSSWGGENFEIRTPDRNMGTVPVESWITLDVAKQLLSASGHSFENLKKMAVKKEFRPVVLPAQASFKVKNTVRETDSRNVIARLDGDPLNDEYIIYSAHWDHLGRDSSLKGDQIFNGAIDNASGTAALLEIAQAFTRLGQKPRRTILFAALTAEEQGLLGAKYYVENPVYPLNKTVADINIDGMNQWGRTRDLVVIGLGNSTLDDVAAEVARTQGRTLKSDAEPEKGFYYRADHFEFGKQGIPAFYTDSGTDFIGKPAGYAEQKRKEFTENDYHKVSDEVKPDWDLSGGVEDTQFLFLVGLRVSEAEKWPEWKPGTEFKAKREAMLR
jgi:Zn-dependent M28 family amino/carboxypeptidase